MISGNSRVLQKLLTFFNGISKLLCHYHLFNLLLLFRIKRIIIIVRIKISSNTIIIYNYNPGQNIWHKVKKYSKNGQNIKNVISNFVCFWQLFSAFNFWKVDWALDCVSTHIWHFSNISSFPKILSLKSFGNSWGNSCNNYRFTCGETWVKLFKKS